ncbi:MAG TPA: antitoxin family protein [Pirellulales bacterium]|nr:antitoxin family protein [Pirellulales bacterium]
MAITIDAIYEDGSLKLAAPLPLPEHEPVEVTVRRKTNWVAESAGLIKWTGTPEDLQRFAEDPELDHPTAPEVS